MSKCELCGDATAAECLCDRCRYALLSGRRTVTPTIVAQIRGDVPAVVGQSASEALRSLCAVAECSRPRRDGSLFCAACEPLRVTTQPIGEDNGMLVWPAAEDVTIYPARSLRYEGRLTIAPDDEDDLGAFRGLFWAFVWCVLIPAVIYAVGWGHGIR